MSHHDPRPDGGLHEGRGPVRGARLPAWAWALLAVLKVATVAGLWWWMSQPPRP